MAPRIVDKEARRLELVRAAARVFAREGFRGARIADVATEAGLGKGTVYEYFRSKEELFFAVFEWSSRRMESEIAATVETLESAGVRLLALGREAVRQGVENLELYGLTLEFWAAAGTGVCEGRFREAFKELYRELRALVQGIIEDGQARGELRQDVPAEHVAGTLVGALDALVLQHWFDRSLDPLASAQGFLETLIRGMVNNNTESPASTGDQQTL